MDNILTFPEKKSKSSLSLLESYENSLISIYNKAIDTRTINYTAANYVVPFLTASMIAFRCLGDEKWASKFEDAATSIENDWKLFQPKIHRLIMEIQCRDVFNT